MSSEPTPLSMIHAAQERMLKQLEDMQRELRDTGSQVQRLAITLETFQRDMAMVADLQARVAVLETSHRDEQVQRRTVLAGVGLLSSIGGAVVAMLWPIVVHWWTGR